MKKYIILMGITLLSLIIVSIEPTYGYEIEDYQLNINSNQLYEFIEEKNLKNISEFCTTDFCDYLRSNDMSKAIELFKAKYLEFLKQKVDEETALSTILKGFPITKITTLYE